MKQGYRTLAQNVTAGVGIMTGLLAAEGAVCSLVYKLTAEKC